MPSLLKFFIRPFSVTGNGWLFVFISLFLFCLSCKKNSFITSGDAVVSFSTDTVQFDTVFTSVGTVTESVKIYNQNSQQLLLSQVKLMGGINSPFKINIDGAAGPVAGPIEMDAGDSLYIFVSVFINPSAANLPFILQDSIQVSFNGNVQYIQLEARGQNAHFLQNIEIASNTVWTDDLPYVILGGLQVDSNAVLTMQQGCKIYVHANAPIIINGTLLAQGNKYDSTRIFFQGDRLDNPYNRYPASWPGIYFSASSKDNVFEFASIRNAYQGIIAANPSEDGNPKVILDECIIDNIYDAGILGVQTAIQARNCLISNCGRNIALSYGGQYSFVHCTVASYSNDLILHLNPVLNLSNYAQIGNNLVSSDLTADFTNCIFWGDYGTVTDEVVVSQQGGTIFSVGFTNCLWKVQDNPIGVTVSGIIANQDPLFNSIETQTNSYDFHLKPGSPAVNAGTSTPTSIDLDGNPRPVGLPDLGCYEVQ